MGIIRFAVKVGLAGTAVYYLKEEGVWNDSEMSLKALDKLKDAIDPHLEQIKTQVPIELPKLPESKHIHHILGNYWNKVVMSTFEFLKDLPEHASTLSDKSTEALLQNEEIKKFIDNFNKPINKEQ